jgi:hypothetical protein
MDMRSSRWSLLAAEGLGPWLGTLALCSSGFLVTTRLAPYSTFAPLSAHVFGFSCVVACAIAASASVPSQRRWLLLGASCGLGALIAIARSGATGPLAAVGVLVTLSMLGSAVGALVGSRIQHPGHLLFVALVSGLADILSVTQPGGVSRAIAEQPQALALLALPWPMLGTHETPPFLGVGDVIFTSLYWSASRKHGLRLWRTALALVLGYALVTWTVIALARPIPVLPFLGVCMLLVQARSRTPAARDRRGAWAMTALTLLIAAWALQRNF